MGGGGGGGGVEICLEQATKISQSIYSHGLNRRRQLVIEISASYHEGMRQSARACAVVRKEEKKKGGGGGGI